ncbi:MAG: cell division protein ZapE [Legionella sp.]|jgi:cell division protein ZapE|nr:cell division protein ZapE [Legionella sp.]
MKKLSEYYAAAVAVGELDDSPNQRAVLDKLQAVADAIDATHHTPWWRRLLQRWWRVHSPKGLYLHGPVGAGKTYLMDMFYGHVPESHKRRFHFHKFMQYLDDELRHHQGRRNPLRFIAKRLARSAHVLCLDEFLVEDVADASILAEVLRVLFSHGMILVATANTKPDDLYLDGLHRERFLPAINLIKQQCDDMCLDDHRDYRLGRDARPEVYFYPINEKNTAKMLTQFEVQADGGVVNEAGEISIQQRLIPYIKRSRRVIWFDFDVICNLPRSQLDYLEITEHFDTVCVSYVPAIGADEPARIILFIRFVDVMYDQGMCLLLLAEVPLNQLYVDGPMSTMFRRTLSRLQEMQSADYWRHGRRQSD